MKRGVFGRLRRPLVMGHRGACRYAPENTWESFDLAVRLGADVLETDARLSRDGEVVLCHDVGVARTTDGSGAVHQMTYPEIATLDAGFHFSLPSGEQPFRGQGVRIPRLEDMLRAFPTVAFNIEIKGRGKRVVRAVLDVLERAAAGSEAIVLAAADPTTMADIEAARPGCGLSLSRQQALSVLKGAWMGQISEAYHGRALQIPPRFRGIPLISRRLIRRAADAHIDVHVWTINEPPKARRLLQRGIDGLISDDPAAILEVAAPWRAHG